MTNRVSFDTPKVFEPSVDIKLEGKKAKNVGIFKGIGMFIERIKLIGSSDETKEKHALKVANDVFGEIQDGHWKRAIGHLNHMNDRQLIAFQAVVDNKGSPALKEKLKNLFKVENGNLVAHKNLEEMKNVEPLGFFGSIWNRVFNWRQVAVSLNDINAKVTNDPKVKALYDKFKATTKTDSTVTPISTPKIAKETVEKLRTFISKNYKDLIAKNKFALALMVISDGPQVLAKNANLPANVLKEATELYTLLKQSLETEDKRSDFVYTIFDEFLSTLLDIKQKGEEVVIGDDSPFLVVCGVTADDIEIFELELKPTDEQRKPILAIDYTPDKVETTKIRTRKTKETYTPEELEKIKAAAREKFGLRPRPTKSPDRLRF